MCALVCGVLLAVDEAVILGGFVYWVGPSDVLYSLKHAYTTWVQPRIAPYIDQYLPAAAAEVLAKPKDD